MTNEQRDYGVTTDEIMDFLKENMVTKKESEQFATKEDLKRFVSKEELRTEIGKLRSDITDLFDRKLNDFRGDSVLLTRKEDAKLLAVVGKLEQKDVFTAEDAKEIQKMEPFPKLMVS